MTLEHGTLSGLALAHSGVSRQRIGTAGLWEVGDEDEPPQVGSWEHMVTRGLHRSSKGCTSVKALVHCSSYFSVNKISSGDSRLFLSMDCLLPFISSYLTIMQNP